MIHLLSRLFSTEIGNKIYNDAVKIIKDASMEKSLSGGALVGFSGGADSVMLLCVLKKYSQENGNFKLCAVHVNHMIRGDEADRDEGFSRDFCSKIGVEFIAVRKDVPSEARALSAGLEEVARNIRYSVFNEIISGRNDISCISVAHNSTDNLETVIFNLMRGCGSRGASGISPVRDNVIRPLISTPKRDIVKALNEASIDFVTDSTNLETDYTRNYIRQEILPKFSRLSPDPEAMAFRFCQNLRFDVDFIESEAKAFVDIYDGSIPTSELALLHRSIFSRAISYFSSKNGAGSLERTHIDKIHDLISKRRSNFSVSLPGGVYFRELDGACSIARVFITNESFERRLTIGENYIPELDILFVLSYAPITDISSNVYKISINKEINSDIIKGELTLRNKRDGDSYVYGGMRRKLKKLFNDRSIPLSERQRVPVLCDEEGILWVSGFPARDGGDKKSDKKLFVAIAHKA